MKRKEHKEETQVQPETVKTPDIVPQMQPSELLKFIPLNDTGNIKIGYRASEFLKTPILLGRERVIILANGDIHKSVFAIVELERILASHNENSFENTKDYPTDVKGENINDRNYKDDKNAQYKVREIAEKFNPDTQISTSATAAGLPIITIDGIVVSGNNRIMSMKLMVSEYPENYKNYLKILGYEIGAGGYGYYNRVGNAISSIGTEAEKWMAEIILEGSSFDKKKSIKFKQPILVRIDLEFPEYNTLEMSKYNKDTKKVERPIDKAIKLGKILEGSPSCSNIISDKLAEFENISEFYASSPSVNLIKNNLISCNILTQNEIPAYIDKNTFSVAGKEFLENLMAGMILDKEQLIISELEGVKRYKQIIVQSLPVLIKNSKLNEFSLRNYLNEAISIQHKLVSGNFTIPDLISQFTMFADIKETYSEKSYYINLLLSTGKNKFKQTIESYNKSAEQSKDATMFGEPVTINELFDKIIIPKLDEAIVKFLKQYFSKKAETIKIKITKEQLTQLIRGLEIQNKYKPNENITKRLRALKITLKYSK